MRIICNVISFLYAQIFCFRLTSKTYPKFCQMSMIEYVIKNPVAEKRISKEQPIQ